ncbi:MAG: 2Fe-2S iron-sulfur cluster binding domain-containing protein [Betaproteobacteria bacterium]|nr:2Fe-2S iron-sulfur cluster binding domain-containing protein [Betaproteobacteria bacterium]
MTHWLTVWRASQLVGVSRGTLERKIRAGALRTLDGRIASDELLRAFPQAAVPDPAHALPHRPPIPGRGDAVGLPPQKVLAQRLYAQARELADARDELQRSRSLLDELSQSLHALNAQSAPPALAALAERLDRALAAPVESPAKDVLAIIDDVLKIMSAQVSLRPSGREFLVEGRNTLLQAALSAGCRVNYGCTDGSCGLCKARVVEGSVAQTAPQRYALSDAEKARGYTLLCTHTAASSDLVLEALEARGPQDLPLQTLEARVRAVTPLAEHTLDLHLVMPEQQRLRFLSGQEVRLAWHGHETTLPIANCPCDDLNLHFFLAREAPDALTLAVLAGQLKKGDSVRVTGPEGEFVLHDGGTQLVFIACDLGMAPIKGLMEHTMAIDAAEAISLYWLTTRSDGHFLDKLCRAWSEALDQFDVSLFTATDPAQGALELVEAMQADLFVALCDIYVAGPPEFAAQILHGLRAAGVPRGQIHVRGVAAEAPEAPPAGRGACQFGA